MFFAVALLGVLDLVVLFLYTMILVHALLFKAGTPVVCYASSIKRMEGNLF